MKSLVSHNDIVHGIHCTVQYTEKDHGIYGLNTATYDQFLPIVNMSIGNDVCLIHSTSAWFIHQC